MKLSIVIPYYNSNAWIGETLESLLDQGFSHEEYEIIVVDDASDEEPVVLNNYVASYPCIHYYNQGKLGMSGARNFGISVAKGDWVFFCDSDDYLQRKVLLRIIDAAEQLDLDVIFANFTEITPNKRPCDPKRDFSSLSEAVSGVEYYSKPHDPLAIAVWCYIVKRELIIANDLRFRDVYCAEERHFYQDLLFCASRVAHIDVDMYYYVRREDSVSRGKKRLRCSEYMSYLYGYIYRLSEDMNNGCYDSQVVERMKYHMGRCSFILLHNVFRYCPVKETTDYLARLTELEAYPIIHYSATRESWTLVLKWINIKWLWVLGCRLYHIVPLPIRVRF